MTRYSRAERDLKQARPFGEGAKQFYAVADIKPPTDGKELLVAMTSDRGNFSQSFNVSNKKFIGIWLNIIFDY